MKISQLTEIDPFLIPFERTINRRFEEMQKKEKDITNGVSLSDFANGYLYFGLHNVPNGWIIREWAPNATNIYIIGEFSNWKPQQKYKFKNIENGIWEGVFVNSLLSHLDLYKLYVEWDGGSGERIPSYAQRVIFDDSTHIATAQVWHPESKYKFKNKISETIKNPLIYEVHTGMSSEEPKVSTYNEFRQNILPRIKQLGYNVVQLMAIQEHPYYGSFGYQVSNFFAPSSRFGTPDELKQLIDAAHGEGIAVVLDIVHSHSVKNENEGLSRFDGTEYQYFHKGERGNHPVWDSRCFDYAKNEVIHFLLSNCKYWLEEYKFDGFRFDGVTSMIYTHHGLGTDFGDYRLYFDGNQDEDAITYLYLANKLIHSLNQKAITIAEDVSGMPGMAIPQQFGGIGFDFRMSMGVADFWSKVISEKRDEDWIVGDIFFRMSDKRVEENTISYAECHDQAMVGDKTIIFRLADKEMYSSMSVLTPNIIIDRGIALHKMIRLITISLAGGGYLNFMGNEFGHPEWIDFPRKGNDFSYYYARRQWHLVDDKLLKYQYLRNFDEEMIKLVKAYNIFSKRPQQIVCNNGDHVLIFERNELIFAFNFHPTQSYTDYGFEITRGKYKIILDSDSENFCGFKRNDDNIIHSTKRENGTDMLKLYLPSRTALVLIKGK
ncbi:MAG: alpha amylase C-terminal domain-containing protein [Prevotellaceae bacterium]|jgi:1,4-alpha-glucan branching enzyme|nr:alpha amylase C-terminal domain-containing protein [Prevotellaceae bacterium]